MKASRQLELAILSGEQQGARAPLDTGATVDISASVDSDIVINDASLSDEKMSLKLNAYNARLRIVSGSATVMGKKLTAGQSKRLKMYQKVEVGEMSFAYGEVNSTRWRDSADNVQFIDGRQVKARYLLSKIDRYFALRAVLFLSVVVAGVLFSLELANAINNHQDEGHRQRDRDELEAKIPAFNLQDMRIATLENGQMLIEGYIDARDKYDDLMELIDSSGVSVRKNITLGEDIASEVKNIYRLNGFVVDASIKEKGIVQIEAKSSNLKELKKIRSLALKDVRHLNNILISAEGGEVAFDQADKRIRMVATGATAYILTADGAKYYAGSELSSGHKIIDIQNNNIVLLKDGKKSNYAI